MGLIGAEAPIPFPPFSGLAGFPQAVAKLLTGALGAEATREWNGMDIRSLAETPPAPRALTFLAGGTVSPIISRDCQIRVSRQP